MYMMLVKDDKWDSSIYVYGFFESKDDLKTALLDFNGLEKDLSGYEWWFDSEHANSKKLIPLTYFGVLKGGWNKHKIAIFKIG